MLQFPCWYFLGKICVFDSVVLKSPIISVLLSMYFLKSSKIFLIYFGAPVLCAYVFIIFMSSWWILPLGIMKCPSGSLFMAFVLKSILSYVSIATQLFSCPFAWNIFFFQPWSFGLCSSFFLRWASCGQHMCEPCFLIHSATLCLIGAFNLLTFKVIIDR